MAERAERNDEPERADIAATIGLLARSLVAAEQPVLREHGLSMWGYIVLNALKAQPVRTQSALAQAIGADKTRLIGILDDLQRRELIRREPDPEDRRVHLLSITDAGRNLHRSAQVKIRLREGRLLDRLAPKDRQGFVRALQVLATLPVDEIINPD
jgi:DNA-binding MarR family transcriptional regulator